jgi:hypothetical protein
MKIYGLLAREALAKRYFLNSVGKIEKTPYPMVSRFTSADLGNNLNAAVRIMAEHGGCLLKGELDRDLHDESRAGHTHSHTKTGWVCLDLDGVTAWTTIDDFLRAIGSGGVDYIIQWSNSAGFEPGLRAHVFMAASQLTCPDYLKRWLKHLNLSTPELRSQLTLNKLDNALKWPLDVSTCQNDKLIYVAPPVLGPGIADPFAGRERIEFAGRGAPALTIPEGVPSGNRLEQETQALVAELRAAKGLVPLPTAYDGDEVCVLNPEAAQITGIRERGKFRYFNLNGGDSWGYHQPIANPIWVHNFKGEPKALTSELLPEFWKQLVAASRAAEGQTK